MDIWRRRVLTVYGALVAAPASCVPAVLLNDWLRGRNVSDVGVPMFEHSDRGVLAGLVVIVVVCSLMLALLDRTIGNRGLLAYWVGIPWMLVCAGVFQVAAPW